MAKASTMWCLLLLVIAVRGFNIDTHNYVSHRGNPGSMFGFSVASHRERSNSWLVVGAPEAQTSQPGVTRGGAVYRCDIGRNDACALIEFDKSGNNNSSDGNQIDQKSYQWFGATVRSSGQDGVILACAPRYIWYSTTTHIRDRRDPVGTCWTAKNQFSDFSEFSPCRTKNWGYHRQGSCQAGLGASVSKDGSRLYIGAVGSWYWQGQVISQHMHARPDVISSNEGPLTDDDSYLGYSVTTGDFGGGSGGYQDVAVGMPRGQALLGKVVLFTWNMSNIVNVTGQQLGAYFGYSVCSADVDGDGRDDLIVGAPLYTDLNNNKGDYETGRVYIIYQGTNEETAFQENVEWRDGVNSRGRFGLSVTSLGDINLDGFQDFAVGAPYDGAGGRGAVYIYHGSPRGVREVPAQVIRAEQVAGQPYTFGFSLAGGLDLDDNQYPDLVVGAYLSDTAVLLRSRPVVRTEASLVFSGQSKQVSLEEKNCSLRDGTRVVCLELNSCLKYTGIGVDKRIEFEIQFNLDTMLKSPTRRMFFMSDEKSNIINQTVRLDKDIQFCKKMSIYLKPGMRDKLTTLEAEMRFGLKGAEPSATRSITRHLSAVLDTVEEPVRRDSVIIQKDCGIDNICIPNLRLIASPNVKQYLLGSGENLVIEVEVQNEGEDAFEATFDLNVPTSLNYVNIERSEADSKDVLCSSPSPANNNTLHCDIGNPLPKEKLVQFKVLLQPHRLESLAPRYEFYMRVNSTNPEQGGTLSDNRVFISVPIWVETDLILQGSSQPVDLHYNGSQYQDGEVTQDTQIGPQVNHVYSIRNKGPANILEAEAIFYWPANTLAGDHLLYLLEQPETSGNIRCDVVEQVNLEKINIERRRKPNYEATFEGLHSSQGLGSSLTQEERWRLEELGRKKEQEGTVYTSNGGKLESDSRLGGGQNRSWSRESSWAGDGATGYNKSWGSESSWSSETGREGSSGFDSGARGHQGGDAVGVRTSYTRTENRGVDTSGRESAGRDRGHRTGSFVRTEGRESHRVDGTGRVISSGRDRGHEASGTFVTRTDNTESHRGVETTGRETSSSRDRGHEAGTFVTRTNAREGHRGVEAIGRETNIDRDRGHEATGTFIRTDGRETHRGVDVTSRESFSGSHRDSHRSRGHETSGTFVRTDNGESNRDEDRWRESQGRGVGVPSTSFEERNYERNSTWNSRDRRPQVSTRWSVNRDGVVESGSSQGEGDVEGKDESYFRGRGAGYNATWMVTGDKTGHSDSQSSRETSGGGRTYSEERHVLRNTTWSDSEGPITSEQSSWRVDQDGKVTNGSTSRVVHRDRDMTVHTIRPKITIHRTSGLDHNLDVDQNLDAGGRFYSEDKEVHQNTTWSSATGGRPVTHESRHWRINQDGVVSNGSTSNVYQGEPVPVDGITSRGSYGTSHSGSRSHSSGGSRGHSSESSQSGSRTSLSSGTVHTGGATIHSDSGTIHMGTGTSHGGTGTIHTSGGTIHTSGSRQGSESHGQSSGSESSQERGSERSESRSRVETHRRRPVNVNIGDMMNRRQNQGLDLGVIAQGPRDGVARTHTFDLGVLDRQEGGSVSGSREHESRGHESRGHGQASGSSIGSSHSASGIYESSATSHGNSGGYSASREFSGSSHGGSGGYSASREFSGTSQGSSGGYSASRESSHGSSGGYSANREYSSSGSRHGSAGFSGRHNEDDGSMGSRSSSSRSWSRSYSSTSGTADGDQAGHGGMYAPRSARHTHHRHTRQVEGGMSPTELECRTTNCARVRCIVGPLKKDDEAIVTFKSRLWVNTLKQLTKSGEVSVSSMVVATVTGLPHIGRPDMDTTKSLEVFTRLVPRHAPPRPDVVPLWVVVLSACAGALLLMLLVYLLYKVGFFKRNRPSNSPEKQPLNRNGHYQPGDEAL